MGDPAELELSLERRGAASYAVEMRFRAPASDTVVRLLRAGPVELSLDPARLRELALDVPAYGNYLGACLFGSTEARIALAEARAVAASHGVALRLRIVADERAAAHTLRWETLHDPFTGAPLLGEALTVVREVTSADLRPSRPSAHGGLKALVAVAAPAGLASYGLHPIDHAAEAQLAGDGLAPIPTTLLAGPGQATAARIAAGLRDGATILYLVAHGAIMDGEGYLLLEDGAGGLERVSARDLALLLGGLPAPPRLTLLIACQGAGDGDEDVLAAVGSRLAATGLPAVLAMQGPLRIATARRFLPALCEELRRDGAIDRAVAAARAAIAGDEGWWRPALFMRARDARLWANPAPPAWSLPAVSPLRPAPATEATGAIARHVWQLDAGQRALLAERLLGCRSVRDSGARALLIASLPTPLGSLLRDLDDPRTFVEALVAGVGRSHWVLEALVDSLREREGRSEAMARLDEALALLNPQPVSMSQLAELRAALRGDPLSPAIVHERFRAVTPAGLQLPFADGGRGALACALDLLARLPVRPDAPYPLLRFVEGLLPALAPRTQAGVRDWLVARADELGVSGEPRGDAAEGDRTGRGPIGLLVELAEAAGRRFRVQAWLWGARVELVYADDGAYTLREVREGLLPAIYERIVDDLIAADDDLTVEFFLPLALVAEAVDQWSLNGEPLGFQYRVVVRSQERASNRQLWPRWHSRWRQLKAGAEHASSGLVEQIRAIEECRERLLRMRLEQAAVLALACELPSRAEIRRGLIETLLKAGTPVALLPRQLLRPAAEYEQELAALLDGGALLRLPEQVRLQRKHAYVSGGPHQGEHLTLLWDDPERLPPRAQLSAPRVR